MPQPVSHEAYTDARVYMDQALESKKGIKIWCDTPNDAFRLRMRCYAARSKDRQQSLKIYSMEHPNYGRTPYDTLTFWRETGSGEKVRGNPGDLSRGQVLVIAKIEVGAHKVEEIA